MAIDVEKISEKIFKIMKAYGHQLSLFTDDGKDTLDPTEARRFYSKDKNIMINFETSAEKHIIKVNVGGNINLQELKPLLGSIRNLANQQALTYSLRTFGHDIKPKDFIYQAEQEKQISESFSKPYGTVKTSRQKFENATLYIRHSKKVDEEIRGSRSRNIHAIFVENSSGERFKFPFSNINAARAMTVHVSEGGTPYDNIGKGIIHLSEEIETLKKFKKKNKTLQEASDEFIQYVSERINSIGRQFTQMNNHKGYNRNIETFMTENNIDEVDDSIFEEFGITFNEDENKSFVFNIAKKLKEDKKTSSRIEEFVRDILNGKKIELARSSFDSDPRNPDNFEYKTEDARLSAWFGYFAKLAKDEQIANIFAQLSDDIYQLNKKHVDLAKKLLTSLMNGAIVSTQEDKPDGLLESISQELDDKLSTICGIYLD
jgi:hypothetical protein